MTLPGGSLDVVQASALVGAVLPIVAAIPKQNHLSYRTNALIVVLVAAAASVLATGVSADLTPLNLATSFALTYTTAVAFDHGLWRPTGIAAAVQTRTSVRRRRSVTLRPLPGRPAPKPDLARC